jgi:predicted enzyme related to lactoylglutathione lyase
MTANLYRVIHPVSDIEIATEFFSAVLGAAGERVSPGRHYFKCGATILACYDPVADGDDLGDGWRHHGSQYLYFAVADLDATFASVVQAGGAITAEIETMPWGERIFYARDPGGNPISFVDQSTVFTGSSQEP